MFSSVTSSYMAGHRLAPPTAPLYGGRVLFYDYANPLCWNPGFPSNLTDLSPQTNNGSAVLSTVGDIVTTSGTFKCVNMGSGIITTASQLKPNLGITGALTSPGTTTIIFWMYLFDTALPSTIISKGTGGAGYYLSRNTTNISGTVVSSTPNTSISPASIVTNTWTMITYQPSVGGPTSPSLIYINSILGSSWSTPVAQPSVYDSNNIRWAGANTYQAMHQVFNVRLTETEIAQIYADQRTIFNV